MDAKTYIRDALTHAHLRACTDANEDAIGALTALINSLDDGDVDVTTGTTGTTGSSAPVDTILRETGIVPSGHNTPEQDIIVEIARLRGELNAYATDVLEARKVQDELAEGVARLTQENTAISEDNARLRAQVADLTPPPTPEAINPADHTREDLDGIAREEDVQGAADMATKQDVADAINTKRGVTA